MGRWAEPTGSHPGRWQPSLRYWSKGWICRRAHAIVGRKTVDPYRDNEPGSRSTLQCRQPDARRTKGIENRAVESAQERIGRGSVLDAGVGTSARPWDS